MTYPFDALSRKAGEKIQQVCRQVMRDSRVNLVDGAVHCETAVGIPHHLSSWVLHPCFEADIAESKPCKRILLSGGTIVDFDLWRPI